MKIEILTLFPGMFDALLSHSILKRALDHKKVFIKAHNLRDYTHDRHQTCDDRPYGGGPGMLMKPEPIFEATRKLFGKRLKGRDSRFIYMSPKGKLFTQNIARGLTKYKNLFFLCGHYEGVDQRVIDALVTDELSIGDYVLTGGELPAMVVIDAVARLLPGVIGNHESAQFESFSGNLLEYPQYTRPAIFEHRRVPSVLLSGNHEAIRLWQEKKAREVTKKRRPDLMDR